MKNSERRNFLKTSALWGTGLTLCGFNPHSQSLSVTSSEELSVLDCIHHRRSVRAFKSDPVSDEHLRIILDAARMAPTSGNQQPWKFLVVRDRKKLDELRTASMHHYLNILGKQGFGPDKLKGRKKGLESHYEKIFRAPVFIAVLVDTQSKYHDYNKHDGPLAVANLMLAARSLGYGTCYFTDTISEQVIMKVLQIPDRYRRICITPVGVPEAWPETPPKKDLDDLIFYEELKVEE